MALNAFVAIGMALWIFSPNDASAAGGGYTGITTGSTGGANPGYVITWEETDGGCTSTSLSGPPNPNPIVWTVPSPSVGSGTMTASIHSGGGTQQPPSPGFGSAECAGTVVATLTWDDDGHRIASTGSRRSKQALEHLLDRRITRRAMWALGMRR